jgi:ATP-dependent helicase HrpB
MQSLPIDSILPEILSRLRTAKNLVLEAPPGAGKTTRVPAALLAEVNECHREILVLEPRRLAARMAARRVAEERGEKPGESVGYQVRFEEISGPATRLRFLTEGVLTRRLLADPKLNRVGIVVLDEFHERHLQADLALALLRRLQQSSRPDLKLVVMSATLDAAPIARYLDDAPVLRSEGKRFDVAIDHPARPDDRPLSEQVAGALRRLIDENLDGDVLVFLPGAAEIRRAQAACEPIAAKHDLAVLPLHGDLSMAEQDNAVRRSDRRKVILSTNVAESSVTIEGIVAVIDSGLARIAGHSPWSGLPQLIVSRISKASCVQRAGRAGRLRPGRCMRLYTVQDFHARPEHEAAEIHRQDLAEAALELHAAGIEALSKFDWFEAPSAASIAAADELLARLGAIDSRGRITETGRQMLRYPMHPRQSRMMIEAELRGGAADACVLAALIGERDIVSSGLFKEDRGANREARSVGPSDLLDRLDLFREAERVNFAAHRLRDMNLDPGAVAAVERVRKQLMRIPAGKGTGKSESHQSDDALLMAILAGYPDRVARRRTLKGDNYDLLLSIGGAATLSPRSVVRKSEFLVAVEAEERRERGREIRIASEIKPEWLIDLFAERMREVEEVRWNAQAERVEVAERLLYDELVVSENRGSAHRGEAAARMLAEAALSAGLHRFIDPEQMTEFLARVEFIARTFPESGTPILNEADMHEAMVALCDGLGSFAELREAAGRGGLIEALKRKLNGDQLRLFNQMAPEFVSIAGRRQVRVHYETGRTPYIESRLQDFFGMRNGPVIAGGRVPLVLHLLAPNQRPMQVTNDLSGFWIRLYPSVRKELSRRYPRHKWPEDPLKPAGS